MKSLKIIFLMSVLLVFSFYGEVSAKNIKEVDPHYDWTIEFNQTLDTKSINEYTVVVFDKRYVMEEGIKVSASKNAITVKAPKEGYKSGETYTIRISEVKFTNGKTTKSEIKFAVKEDDTTPTIIVDQNKELNIITDIVKVPQEYNPYFRYTPLTDSEAKQATDWLNQALNKYPTNVLNNIDNIYIAKELWFFDAKYGGTYLNNDIYVSKSSYSKLMGFEKLFHAEFSSILLNKNKKKFNNKEWQKANPKNFKYSEGNGYEYLLTLKDFKYDASKDKLYLQSGFLTEYATTSLENDFNSIARAMFSGDKNLWDNVDKYPELSKKLDLTIKFYNSIDPMFTKEYFKNL